MSGISVFGEQRGAALVDFDHDGRVDVAVSQNSAATKLYANRSAKRGLRVELKGATSNPDAIGAQVRVVYPGDRKGPVRTIQAGSGYWSQDAAAPVLGLRERPQALWIRWPGGKEQTVPVKDGEWNIRITFEK
ncbi:MAG: ASPIC/UnbV domain-containing protein [Verrucomicrobia bacterium]|nr:ASPIC/UnbV domain-containing protein [Verrucomicrobiota bacterium]